MTLRGRLAPGPAGVLEGPASQEACVWWQVAARLLRNGGGVPDFPERAASEESFRLTDDAGEASVLVALGTEGLHGTVTAWYCEEKQYGFSDYPDIPVARRVRARCPDLAELLTGRQAPAIEFAEYRLEPGDRADVTGFLSTDAETGEPVLRGGTANAPDALLVTVGDPAGHSRRLRRRRLTLAVSGASLALFGFGLLLLGPLGAAMGG